MNINRITSYIDYLKNDCSLSVSVHFSKEAFASLPNEIFLALLPYNSHNNPYCMAIKREKHHMCIQSQRKLRKSLNPDSSFCRTCFAGVSEYICPVCKNKNVIGFVAVSGYRGENASGTLMLHLNNEPCPKEFCDTVIFPLALMLEQLFIEYGENETDEYNQILQFLNEYHTNISIPDLAKHFGRSTSFISHLFKGRSGMSFSAYCNELKLSDAEKLLRTTDIPITQIALDAGFCDTSYFISLFRKRFGETPLRYRKTIQKRA